MPSHQIRVRRNAEDRPVPCQCADCLTMRRRFNETRIVHRQNSVCPLYSLTALSLELVYKDHGEQ